MVEAQLVAKHTVNGVGQRSAFARSKTAVVAKKLGYDGVGGVVKFEGQPNEFGAGF